MVTVMSALEPVTRLTKDLKEASRTLSKQEARFLVDYYYQMQEHRIHAANQARAMRESGEPHEVILWLEGNTGTLEGQIKRALNAYAESDPVGAWAMSIAGTGR